MHALPDAGEPHPPPGGGWSRSILPDDNDFDQ